MQIRFYSFVLHNQHIPNAFVMLHCIAWATGHFGGCVAELTVSKTPP